MSFSAGLSLLTSPVLYPPLLHSFSPLLFPLHLCLLYLLESPVKPNLTYQPSSTPAKTRLLAVYILLYPPVSAPGEENGSQYICGPRPLQFVLEQKTMVTHIELLAQGLVEKLYYNCKSWGWWMMIYCIFTNFHSWVCEGLELRIELLIQPLNQHNHNSFILLFFSNPRKKIV